MSVRLPVSLLARAGASLVLCIWMASLPAAAQPPAAEIDVTHYTIEAEVNPRTQDLQAKVQVQFAVVGEDALYATFGLHNSLNVSRVVNSAGTELPFTRSRDDFSLRLSFPQPLRKGEGDTLTFTYAGRLTGREESPVWGVTFAAIKEDIAYLLYPSRWFPISGYTADRYTADMRVTVPAGYKVIASGIGTTETAAEQVTYEFRVTQPSFPGSIAVVRGEPQRVETEGVVTELYFRDASAGMAGAYGQEIGRIVTYLSSVYGLPPQKDLTVVETEAGTPNGYSAPGILFLTTPAIGKEVNARLLVNQIARQWWGTLLSPANRNHLWLTNGAARFSELLWIRETQGPSAFEAQLRDNYIEALTVGEVPLIQAARLEDYSPEFWAATAGKGAAVLNMLRRVIGEEAFGRLLKAFPEKYAWQSVYTADFRQMAEQISGRNLQGFFIQWIESSGAPEFQLEYTVFRTKSGFRIMGKITQDLDTFRMPVKLRIETEGNPEEKEVEVVGASSDFVIETFGKPKNVIIDPDNDVLRLDDKMRVAVAIRRGEQFAEIGDFAGAIKEYGKALEVNRYSSLAHYRVGEVFFLQRNYQAAANEFREALNGDLDPPWTEVWSHINLGKIFDITGQRERAVNEYNQAIRTKDNTQGAQEEAARYLQQPYQRPHEGV